MPKEFTKKQGKGVTVFTLESDGGVTGVAAVGGATVVKPLGAVVKRNPKEETIKVPVKQKPRQGPLRPQTGGGAHRDKKKEQKQGKEKHRKPYMENDVEEGWKSALASKNEDAYMSKLAAELEEGLRNPKDNPCWKGYHPVGTKKKNDRTVPNCVPKESVAEGNPEYDDEAGMADNNLETLKRAVVGLDNLIQPGTNLPEWCQEKIAVAKSMLVAVWDYMQSEEHSEQGVAEGSLAEIDRRGFLKGLGAAAMTGAAGSALARVSPGGPDDRGFGKSAAGNSQQDLGDGFVATSVDVAGFTVRAVLDTTTNTYFTLNRRPEGGGAIFRNMAPFIRIKNGEVDMVTNLGPKTRSAMKKAGLLQDVDEQGVAEGAKWRKHPDAYDVDDEGNKTPRNPNSSKFGYDPLQRRADTANDAKTSKGKVSALKTSLKMAKGQKGVAEGSGSKYKVKSIGKDNKGEYHISPSTGKKVYKSGANKGDHENPKTGEIKKSVAEARYQKVSAQQKFKNSMKRAGYDMDAGAKRLQDLLDKQKKEREEKEKKDMAEANGQWTAGLAQTMGSFGAGFSSSRLEKAIVYYLQGRHQEGASFLSTALSGTSPKVADKIKAQLEKLPRVNVDPNTDANTQKYIKDKVIPWINSQLSAGTSTAPSTAVLSGQSTNYSVGISDNVAAQKIADKIKGMPVNSTNIQNYVKKYLSMTGKNEKDLPQLSLLVYDILKKQGVAEGNPEYDDEAVRAFLAKGGKIPPASTDSRLLRYKEKMSKENPAEAAPKGWEGTVKAMKKHKEIDNPWALAHYMKNKGYKSHKKEDAYMESLLARLEEQTKK